MVVVQEFDPGARVQHEVVDVGGKGHVWGLQDERVEAADEDIMSLDYLGGEMGSWGFGAWLDDWFFVSVTLMFDF